MRRDARRVDPNINLILNRQPLMTSKDGVFDEIVKYVNKL
jgi:hypothetical protein